MLCGFPIESTFGATFPCGQCMCCRINRRRQKAARIMAEWEVTPHPSFFLTLTYDDDHLPMGTSASDAVPVPQLDKRDVQLFNKRMRKQLQLRYFFVGEYGTQSWRPHYHACVFPQEPVDPLEFELLVRTRWEHGFVQVAELTDERAMYAAHYTTKKLTSDEVELDGRLPEFTLSSRRPGLGAGFVEVLASFYETREGACWLAEHHDISREFRRGQKRWPLDYYMAQALRERLGLPLEAADRPSVKDEAKQEELEQAQARHVKMWRQRRRHGVL